MSKKLTTIEISPPDNLREVNIEQFFSSGHECSYCKGNGFFWGENDVGETVKTRCPVCKGSGMIRAVITVEWGWEMMGEDGMDGE